MWLQNKSLLPPSVRLSSNESTKMIQKLSTISLSQSMWPDWAIFEMPFKNFTTNLAQYICWVLREFEKCQDLWKFAVSTFLGNFCEKLGSFKFHHLVTMLSVFNPFHPISKSILVFPLCFTSLSLSLSLSHSLSLFIISFILVINNFIWLCFLIIKDRVTSPLLFKFLFDYYFKDCFYLYLPSYFEKDLSRE